jgi:Uma2 family endonuclease
MTLTFATAPPRFIPSPASLRRFTVDEYHRMIDAGAFDGDDNPVELLEGWVVYQMGHNPPHDVAVKLVAKMLDRAIPDHVHTRVQSAITTADSEPLPDVAVVFGDPRDYVGHHPTGPREIALVVEVADSSLDRDRNEKAPLYARAGIGVYWIVNLQDATIEVHTDPTNQGYRKTDHFRRGANIPVTIAGQSLASIPVSDILP